ncbi:MAG: outer membrane beta-barrel protein [Bacteroidota bacterium]
MTKSFKLFIFLIVTVTHFSFSQTRIGFTVGLTNSNQLISNPEAASIRYYSSQEKSSKSKSLNGTYFGLELATRLNNNKEIKYGIIYSQKGQKEQITHDDFQDYPDYVDTEFTDEINYLILPIKISFPIIEDEFTYFNFNIGTYLGFGVGGKTTLERFEHNTVFYTPPRVTEGSLFFSSTISSRDDYETTDLIIKPYDLGLTTGFELRIKIFTVFVDYQLGFVNVNPEIVNVRSSSNDNQHNERRKNNQTLTFGVGFWPFNLNN